jgi:GNAT superfamily N-acetyltransferase
MEIRALSKPAEIQAALAFVRGQFLEQDSLGYPKEGMASFLQYLENAASGLDFLEADGEDGTEGVLAYAPATFHLSLFFVAKGKQKQGIGRALMQAFLKLAQEQHAARISVNAAASAVDAYKALGFELCGDAEIRDGISFQPMEYLLACDWLGREVTVVIDRPYGSLHPHYPDLLYTCNYGYVEELMGADGEFQDAYVYGPQEPLEKFRGIVIAIIYRRNDNESKWVVSDGSAFLKQDVINAVGFQEQYFDTRFVWLERQ